MSFEFDSSRPLVVVEVRIVGPDGDAITHLALDTGASATIMGWDVLTIVGYDPVDAVGQTQMTTGSGIEVAPIIKLKRLEALGKQRRNVKVVAHTLPEGASVDGLLGLDFLRKSKITIDFRKYLIELD